MEIEIFGKIHSFLLLFTYLASTKVKYNTTLLINNIVSLLNYFLYKNI